MKHADPKHIETQLKKLVTNKNVVITGGSSGIGKKTAEIFAKAGANVIIIARDAEKLVASVEQINTTLNKSPAKPSKLNQPNAIDYYVCDMNQLDQIDETANKILATHGSIDILINNAGRSIRRPVTESLSRFHDYQRTMQLNFFAAVRLTHAFLPSMMAQKSGHIVNISSYGVLMSSPFFSAYIASKAALDAYGRCLASEVKHQHIHVSTLNLPLVRTPMIAPTKLYNYVPTLTTYDAAILIADAIIHRKPYNSTKLAKLAGITTYLLPQVNLYTQSLLYKITPKSRQFKIKSASKDKQASATNKQRNKQRNKQNNQPQNKQANKLRQLATASKYSAASGIKISKRIIQHLKKSKRKP